MSDAAPPAAAAAQQGAETQRVTELRVSGHLMLLDPGLFCIFQPPGAPAAGPSGLPGVRISPAPMAPAGAVAISTFHADGWLPGGDGAALVRVARGPTPILVTIYQAPDAPPDAAPRLQVLRLSADPAARGVAQPQTAQPQTAQAGAPVAAPAEIVAHVQRAGDLRASLGAWIGTRDSKQWIEGFGIDPAAVLGAEDAMEYRGLLGHDWLSPWVAAGGFCGSRGMALPLLGLAVRLKGAAEASHECRVTASFVDGTLIEAAPEGTVLQAESLAPLEAFRIELRPRAAARPPARPAALHAAPKPAPAKSARRPR